MIRKGDRALIAEVVPLTPATSKLIHLEFDSGGRVREVSCTVHPPDRQTVAEQAATRLVQDMAHELRQAGGLEVLLRRLRLRLELAENLAALESRHRAAAAQLFGNQLGGS